ncbi:NmrA family NAD(P)-binding protein [Azospirillum sp. B4]|uniref:NmrA family NAD(P)-binding protein n=1 Tax=Azospirillum sp. B4 TaxID=95605 RepID=UPI000346784B|nr:NmrA family NAD(P)-binding protein [Azospirillum sp. B4]
MYVITGITGQVGGATARALLAAGQPVRAVVRDAAKATPWADRGCEVAVAALQDAAALTQAFAGAAGVFILPPPDFDPAPGYPAARATMDAVATALAMARPARVVSLSTVGADAPHDNLLSQHTLNERRLAVLDLPITFLRPGWFMENAAWDLAAARDEGVLRSHLQPLDRPIPMVATADVGRVAACLLREDWAGLRIVDLEGPARVSPNDLAQAFARTLGRPVRAEAVPRDGWEAQFRAQGMHHPGPRMRMLDGFNEGWIDFRDAGAHALKGDTTLHQVIAALAERT